MNKPQKPEERFAVFPNYETGRQAKSDLIFEGKNYKDLSLDSAIARYAPPKENDYDVDQFHFDRWDYVLDEMIWAFGQKIIDWEKQYYSGEADYLHQAYDENDQKMGDPYKWPQRGPKGFKYSQLVPGPKHTFKMDMEGLKAHHDRMKNGFKLFGKYYDGLWD